MSDLGDLVARQAGERPLEGKRIAVTRPADQCQAFSEVLESLGATVVVAPLIKLEEAVDPAPLRQAASRPGAYDWIVFTSANAVDRFWQAVEEAGTARELERVRICAIGPATAAAVVRRGAPVSLMPEEYVGESVSVALKRWGNPRGLRVLLPRAEDARAVIARGLTELGAVVDEVDTYRTVPDSEGAAQLGLRLRSGEVDVLTFASSSAVKSFVSAIGPNAGSAIIATIGPVTSRTARQLGLPVHVEARPYTTDSLALAIADFYTKSGDRP